MAIGYSKTSYFNTKTRKNISVRVDEDKYNKILKHIKQVNKKSFCDMLSFGVLVDRMMDRYIKENNLWFGQNVYTKTPGQNVYTKNRNFVYIKTALKMYIQFGHNLKNEVIPGASPVNITTFNTKSQERAQSAMYFLLSKRLEENFQPLFYYLSTNAQHKGVYIHILEEKHQGIGRKLPTYMLYIYIINLNKDRLIDKLNANAV